MKGWGTGDDTDAEQKRKILKLAEDVDKMRVEVVLTGFRLRVQQGRAKEGAGLLDLVVKVGGSIEANLPLLEALGREMAAKMINFQKEGKTKEAGELGVGLSELLGKLSKVPKLSSQQRLFIGHLHLADEQALLRTQLRHLAEFAEQFAQPNAEFPGLLRLPLLLEVDHLGGHLAAEGLQEWQVRLDAAADLDHEVEEPRSLLRPALLDAEPEPGEDHLDPHLVHVLGQLEDLPLLLRVRVVAGAPPLHLGGERRAVLRDVVDGRFDRLAGRVEVAGVDEGPTPQLQRPPAHLLDEQVHLEPVQAQLLRFGIDHVVEGGDAGE